MPQNQQKSILILILGSMTALSPFAIDMYLPSFQTIASDFGTTVSQVSLSLSSYFVGISFGQLFYGPLLDRFGRKPPLYAGLIIFILASFGCLQSHTAQSLVIWRLIQALGGCVAGVGAMTMVRDLFTMKESAKVYSLLILILGASPMFAPTFGSFLALTFGWHSVFIALAIYAFMLLLVIKFFLRESHTADPQVSLKPLPIFRDFIEIIQNAQFYTYVLSGAIAFSGLFVYLAGSPVIFLNHFKVGTQLYGWLFAFIAIGMIGSSQFNSFFLRKNSNEKIVLVCIGGQILVGWLFVLLTATDRIGLYGTIFMFFLYMSCSGLINPNAGALALAPFSRNAGRAAALMGFLQMGLGALISSMVGVFGISEMLPIVIIIAISPTLAMMILLIGRAHIARKVRATSAQPLEPFI
jgi:MFS transporter, DHA1 family, multidrug resistance protein